jgi:hypothetical protein
MKTARIMALTLAAFASALAPAPAQTNRGGLSGTVRDQTGAVVPGATVVVTHTGTGERIQLTTSPQGTYATPPLQPAEYRVEVAAAGFKTARLQRVKVDTATVSTADFRLEVAGLTADVTIVAEPPLVNSGSGTPGQTITERQIVEMPLNNRSVLDLAVTVAHVSGDPGTEDPGLGSEFPVPGFNLFINGGRAGTTSILADGARNTGVGLGRAVVTFSPDTVQEFTVQTSNFSAEYGQTGGGVVNMTTKSGTNDYQGLLYWYHRNPALNAAPFSTATVNRPKSNREQHQFGLTLGGPVKLPRWLGGYDGHDRMFFFAAYEPRYFYDASEPANLLLPTEAMRRGDFSNLVAVTGGYTTRDVAERFGLAYQPVVLYNQFELVGNQLRRRVLAPGQTYSPFPGNQIPSTYFDPLSQRLLQYLPLPGEYFLDSNGQLRNYTANNFVENLEQRLSLRLDHHFGARNHLSARYTQVPIRGDRGRDDFEVGRDEINTQGTEYSWSKQLLLSDTHMFSSTVVNELRLNYTYGRFTRNMPPGFDANSGRNLSTELGLPSLTSGGLPEFITGGGSIGWTQSQQNENAEHTYNVADTVSWVRGNMAWKFGFDLLQQRLKTIPMFGAPGGRYEFQRNRILTNSNGQTTGEGGAEFAQFLLGTYNQVTLRDVLIPYYYQWNSLAAFVQNDWKVRPNLTLNLGFRYSLQLPRTEKYDRQGAFRPDLAREYPLPQPVTLPSGQVVTSAQVPPFAYSGRGGRSRYLTPIDWRGWEPRVSFAWSPGTGGKLTVRGGYGLSHAPLTGLGRNPSPDFAAGTVTYPFDSRVVTPGFVGRICCNAPAFVPKTPEDALTIPDDGLLYLEGINLRGAAAAISPSFRVPSMQSWSLTFAYELPQRTVLELSYQGSKGSHLFLPPISLNTVPFELSQAYLARGLDPLNPNVPDPLGRRDPNGAVVTFSPAFLGTRYLGFEGLNVVLDSRGRSRRHAGSISLRRQHHAGLSYTLNYTYGKSMDTASDSGGVRFTDFNLIRSNGQVTVGAPLDNDWSVSTFDVKHAASATFLWDLPFGRGRRFLSGASGLTEGLLGGWSVSGSGRIQSGVPLVVVLRDDNGLGAEGNVRAVRPNLVPGVPLKNPLYSRDCPVGQLCEPYFNPAAFMRPPRGELGTAPRAIDEARWPTQHTLDLSIQKNFSLGKEGKRRLQLRVDAINVLNHPFFRFGRDSDNGEIFTTPNGGLISTADFNAWADFNRRPRAGTPAGDALRRLVDQIVIGNRIPGTLVLNPAFFSVPVPQGFHSANPNQFDITTLEGYKLYRLRQAYTPDRWGFMAARSPYTPRFIQVALKLYF